MKQIKWYAAVVNKTYSKLKQPQSLQNDWVVYKCNFL